MRKALALAVTLAAGAVLLSAQATGRIATTVSALLAEPLFYHGRQVAIRAGVAESAGGTRLVVEEQDGRTTSAPKLHPVFVYWRQPPSRSDGEIRGEFWDLGRLREDDARFTAYDFRPMLEAASGGRWPNRDELFVILGATMTEWSDPPDPTLRAIVMTPSHYVDKAVHITGRFHGRNLLGDLPSALNRSRWDFVLQSSDAAIWVSNLRPKGHNFELDPGAKMDTARTVTVNGIVRTEAGRVWIDGESIELATAAKDTDVEVPAPPVVKEAPPAVIFSAPLADDTEVGTDTTVRIQFSRDMDGRSFRDHVRVSYAGTPPPGAAPPTAPAVSATYREGNRALEIKFTRPLERFQTVKVELLDGIAANDGQALPPYTLTFSTGGK